MIRVARTGADATQISRDVPKGNPALVRSASVSRASSARERGPMTPSTAEADVTSVSTARASPRWRRIQSASCVDDAADVTTTNASGARRVTVRSASMPPRAFSIWV